MELIKIPLLPQWQGYGNMACVCTPDGGFLYIGFRSINYISIIENKTEAPVIQTFNTRVNVYGVDVDPYWPKKLSITTSAGVNDTVAGEGDVAAADAETGANVDYIAAANVGTGGSEKAGAYANANAVGPNGDGNDKAPKSLPLRMFATANQDYSVQIWDFDKGYVIQGHRAHCADNNMQIDGNGSYLNKDVPILFMSYICNRNILSVDQKSLVIYCVASNTYYRRSMFIPKRYKISTLKCSPYNEHRFAVGSTDGLILLCDLQRMSVLYTLRGNNSTILSLVWNRIVNVEKQEQQQQQSEEKAMQPSVSDISKAVVMNEDINFKAYETTTIIDKDADVGDIKKTNVLETTTTTIDTDADDMFDIYDYNYLDNEFGTSNDGVMMVTNVMKSSQTNIMCKEREGSSLPTDNFNFTEACQNLKDDIKAAQKHQRVRDEQSDYSSDDADNNDELEGANNKKNIMVTLDECKQAAALLQQANPQTFSAAPTISSLSNTIMSNDEQQQGLIKQDQQNGNDTIGSNDGKEMNPSNPLTSSDEGSLYGRIADRNIKFVLHQAEVHEMQTKYEQQQQEKTEKNKIITDGHHHKHYGQQHGLLDDNNKNATVNADILLASISLDCTIGLWNTNTGSSCYSRRIRGLQAAKNAYIYWMDANHLITSDKQGFIKFWYVRYAADQINKNNNYRLEAIQRKALANRPVLAFSFCQTKQVLWYMTVNKTIVMENLQTNEILINLACVATNIGVIKECPDNMNKVALGFSDRRIGIMDMSKITPNDIQIVNFTRSIESPVLSLVWSPDSKKIAYGTVDSRIGILCVENPGKPTIPLKSIFGKPIYSMCWHENYLYVICNARVAIYDESNDFKDVFIIPDIIGASTMSAYKNYLLIGTQKGQLHLYQWNQAVVATTTLRDFQCEVVQRLELARRYITDIQWCPIAIEPTVAIVANSNPIYIYNFNEMDGVLSLRNKIEITSIKASNASVKWSNSNANRFMTCGFDGAIRVWDLSKNSHCNNKSNNPMELYYIMYFPCPMSTGFFLPMDDEVIFCAGKSTSLEALDIRNNKKKHVALTRFYSSLDKVQWATTALTFNDTKGRTIVSKTKKKQTRSGMATSAEQNNDANDGSDGDTYIVDTDDFTANKENIPTCQFEQTSKKVQKLKLEPTSTTSNFLKAPQTLMKTITRDFNRNTLDIMYTILTKALKVPNPLPNFGMHLKENQNQESNESLFVKLFSTKFEAQELLNMELQNLQHGDMKHIASIFIPQLTANLKHEIIKCIQNKQLTEWHVSVAPTISYGFWKDCCMAFAYQLLEGGYALQAATYMLTVHHITEAIDMLLEQHYYKEALLVARVHLEPEDELLLKISDKWISYLYQNGNFLNASLICLLSNQKERAYDCFKMIRNTTPEMDEVMRLLKTYVNNNESY